MSSAKGVLPSGRSRAYTSSMARQNRTRIHMRERAGRARLLATLLATAALSYQGLIPAGYMLGTRADFAAGQPVVACPAQQDVSALQGPHHAHHQHHAGGTAPALHHADSCAFAVAAAAALPSVIFALDIAVPPPVAAEHRGSITLRAAENFLPPVRGPPAIA
jgi:hypothetical protein